ncbi:MAG: hypothetical protein RLZZ511_104 [Cyanobacteriota bacterium]|jgi:hypothetical protein
MLYDFPMLSPQAWTEDSQMVRWDLHAQEIAIAIEQLAATRTTALDLRLLKDQYVIQAQELLVISRQWWTASETDRQQSLYPLVMQQSRRLDRLWDCIMSRQGLAFDGGGAEIG